MTTDDLPPTPIVRTARSLRQLSGGSPIGVSARRAREAAAGLGVATSRRSHHLDDGEVVELPWGVWPAGVEPAAASPALDPRLASYARQLQRKRGSDRQPAQRGLPIVARRRGGTAFGAQRGPGGLANALQPEDHPVPPLDALRDRGRVGGEPGLRLPAPRRTR